ncbi:hypothetical protein BJX61DRAFT_550178 [Aspergillus egyptiacus]|nr:hypothetical protein BJX61DRAFT_550178 [Aspergillus egyptiacus]
MVVGDAYKARMAEKRAIGAHRGQVTGKGSKSKVIEGAEEIEHVESVSLGQEKPTKRQRLRKHCARFWCCYLLAGIVFLAIFLPVFFLVAIPAIAQRMVDDTDLPVYSADITDPKPESVTFTLDTGLTIPMGLSVRLDEFELDLFNRDSDPETVYLQVPVPEYTVKGKTNISVTSPDNAILDEDEFVKTLSKAVYSKRFTMSAMGRTTAHLGALKAKITLDKDVELDGLDQLSGFSIDEAVLLLPAREDGTNLRGRATLPNHSVVTFAMGNVTLNLKSGDIILGTALLPDVVLRPGNNSVAFTGKADINSVLADIGPILSAQSSALRNGNIALSASGNRTIFNGEHITYFERVLNNLTITAEVPIVKILLDTVGELLGGSADGVIGALTDIFNRIDFGSLFEGVDFDQLLGSLGDVVENLNLGSLLEGVDLNQLLQGIDWARVIEAVRSVFEQLDLGAFLENLDISGLINGIDWNAVLGSLVDMLRDVDWGALAGMLNTLLTSVDWGQILGQLRPVLEDLDLGSILQGIDFGQIVENLRPLLENLDLGAILRELDWMEIIRGLGSLIRNLDVRSLIEGLASLDLAEMLDFEINGVNIGDVLGGFADNANGVSLDEALDNFQEAVEGLGD